MGFLFLLIFIFPQSYSLIKLPILGFIIISILINIYLGRLKIYSFDAIKYYYSILLLTFSWILIGAVNGNNLIALYDAFRLFIVYSIVFLCLTIYLTNHDFYKNVDPEFLGINTLNEKMIKLLYSLVQNGFRKKGEKLEEVRGLPNNDNLYVKDESKVKNLETDVKPEPEVKKPNSDLLDTTKHTDLRKPL